MAKAKKYSIDIPGIEPALSDFEKNHESLSCTKVKETDSIIVIEIAQKGKTKPGILNCYISGGQISFSVQGNQQLHSVCEECKEFIIENLSLPADDKKSFTLRKVSEDYFYAFIGLLRGEEGIEIEDVKIDPKTVVRNRYVLKGKYNAVVYLTFYNNGTLLLQGAVSLFFMELITQILHTIPDLPKNAIDEFLEIKPTTLFLDTNLGSHIEKVEIIKDSLIAEWILTSIKLVNTPIVIEDYGCYTFCILKAIDALINKRLSEDAPSSGDYGTYFVRRNNGRYEFRNGVGTYDSTPALKSALEDGYDFFHKHRHTTFHIDSNNIETSRVLSPMTKP